MSDTETSQVEASQGALTAMEAFAKTHGGSAKAVVDNLGAAGARISLVGEDGKLGDIMVSSLAVGEATVAKSESVTAAEWDAETTGQLRIGASHRRKMAGARAR